VPLEDLAPELLEPDTPDARGRPGEVPVYDLFVQADGLEDLGPAVREEGRDAHLGDDLEQPLAYGLDVVLLRLLEANALQQVGARHLLQRLEGEVRVDRRRAVADEQREVVHLARLGGLDDEGGPGPYAGPHQVVVDGGGREQARYGRLLQAHAPVAQDQDRGSTPHGALGPLAEAVQGIFQALLPGRDREQRRERGGGGALGAEAPDLLELVCGEDGLVYEDSPAVLGRLVEEVLLGPQRHLERHHELLAQRVYRGVRDLREVLLEVREKELGPLGEDRQGRIRPHRAVRLLAALRHRGEDEPQVLYGVPERELALEEGRGLGTPLGRRVGELVEVDLTLLQPLPVGLPHEKGPLDVLVVQQLVPLGVDDEHASRPEPPPLDHLLGGDAQRPVLGGHDDPPVLRDRVARRTQPVPVQGRADDAPVGEGDRRGAVPRLHQGAVVLVEGPPLRVHQVVVLPRLGHHHRHRVREAAAGEVE
jgi:hypothetical protein